MKHSRDYTVQDVIISFVERWQLFKPSNPSNVQGITKILIN